MQRNPPINCSILEQLANRSPLQITPETSVLEAIALMSLEQEGSCVLVVNGEFYSRNLHQARCSQANRL